MSHGCGSFAVSFWMGCSGDELEVVPGRGRVLEFAEVVALVFPGDVPVPVGAEGAAGGDGVPACSFDYPGGDGPAAGECRGVVQVRFFRGQVAGGAADALVVLAAGYRGGRGGLGLGVGGDVAAVPGEDVQAPCGGLLLGGGGVAGRGEAEGGFPQVLDD